MCPAVGGAEGTVAEMAVHLLRTHFSEMSATWIGNSVHLLNTHCLTILHFRGDHEERGDSPRLKQKNPEKCE